MVNEWLGAYLFLRFFRYWGSKERKILIVSYIFVMFENKTKIFFQCGKRHKKNKEKIKYFIILVRTFLFVSFNPEGSDVHFMYYYKQHKSNRPLHCFACYLLPTNCKRKKSYLHHKISHEFWAMLLEKILSGSKGYFLFTSFNDRIVQRKVEKWKWLEIQVWNDTYFNWIGIVT